jgi:hypothetical protein
LGGRDSFADCGKWGMTKGAISEAKAISTSCPIYNPQVSSYAAYTREQFLSGIMKLQLW